MNQIQLMRKRNEIAQLIRISNRHRNVLRWGTGETFNHILMKLKICIWLKKQGKEFYTEAIFISGNRADIVNADDAVCYEVIESENSESIEKKKKKYPLPIIAVNANQLFNEKLIL